MQERQVQFMGWEDPLEKRMAHSSILAWEIPCSGAPGWVRVHGVAKSRIQLSTTNTVGKVSFFEIVFQLWCLCFSCDSPGHKNLYISGNVKSISYFGLQSKSVKENCCESHILYGKDSSPLPPPQPSPAVLREHPVSNIPSSGKDSDGDSVWSPASCCNHVGIRQILFWFWLPQRSSLRDWN